MDRGGLPSFPSELQQERLNYKNTLPKVLRNVESREIVQGNPTTAADDLDDIKRLFPTLYGQKSISFKSSLAGKATSGKKAIRAAVVLSGGQAPGGHNVIGDIPVRQAKRRDLVWFQKRAKRNHDRAVRRAKRWDHSYSNMGGFDIIGSGRDKIHSKEQFESSLKHCEAMELDGLVVMAGTTPTPTRAC